MKNKGIIFTLTSLLVFLMGCATLQRVPRKIIREKLERFYRDEIPSDIRDLFFGQDKVQRVGNFYSLSFIDFLPDNHPLFNTDYTKECYRVNYPQLNKIFDKRRRLDFLTTYGAIFNDSYFSPITMEGILIVKSPNSAKGFLSINAHITRYLYDKRLSPVSIIYYVNGEYVRGKEVDNLIGLNKQDLKDFSFDFDSISNTLNIFVRTNE